MMEQEKKTRSTPSLYKTLTSVFVSLSVLALLISGIIQLISNLQTQRSVISDNQQLVAQQAAESVRDFIKEKFDVLKTSVWSTDPISQSKEKQLILLESLLGLQPAFQQLVLVDSQNMVLAHARRLPQESPERFFAMHGDLLAQVREGIPYISSVYLDVDTSEPLIVLASPVMDVFDEYQGFVLAEVNLKFMWTLVESLKVGKTGYAYVVDRAGNLLAYADSARILKGENMAGVEAVDEFISKSSSTSPDETNTYLGIKGSLVVGSYVPLGYPDWAVITELPWNEAYQSVMLNASLAVILTLFAAFITALLASSLALRITASLTKLENTATLIAAGEMDLQVDVNGYKEVTNLASAFNSMTAQLRQTLESLETAVAERTQQLQDNLNFQKEILSSSTTGIAVYNETGQCVLANEATAKLVNGTVEQVLAQNFRQIESWKKSGLYECAEIAFEQRKEVEKEILLVTSFGRKAWFNCRFTTFESGGRPHLLLTVNDMSDHKRIEQEILNLNQKLQKQANDLSATNKELEAFSYSVSHDLRAPLRAINGFTNILLEDYAAGFDEEGKRVCEVIQENTLRMSQLIEDLLAFSRLSRADMQAFTIDMTALVNSVYQELTTAQEQGRIQLTIGKLPDAMGDPILIRQVWSNLIGNAIKFTAKKEHPNIEIGSQPADSENIYYIKDNGAGFDMRYADKLFSVFQRLHSEKEFDGTGVGLAIVQRIIHRHGGRTWGEAKVDLGATFYFSLKNNNGMEEAK